MNTHNRNSIIAGIIIIVILILGFLVWQEHSTTNAGIPTATNATSTNATSSDNTVVLSPNGDVISAPAGYTITPVTTPSSAPQAPNYKAPLTFSTGVTADERSQLQSQFDAAQAVIAKSPNDFNAWISLGLMRKEAGDYQGAAADWQYMSALYPTNIVSNANLGDLYTNYLPNYPKAAAAYKVQIANDPTDVYIYVNLYDLYTNQYPQSTSTIVALLKQGLAANPGNDQLQSLLVKYQ